MDFPSPASNGPDTWGSESRRQSEPRVRRQKKTVEAHRSRQSRGERLSSAAHIPTASSRKSEGCLRASLLDGLICFIAIALTLELYCHSMPAVRVLCLELIGIVVWVSLSAIWGNYRRDWPGLEWLGLMAAASFGLAAYVALAEFLSDGPTSVKLMLWVWCSAFFSLLLARVARQPFVEKLDAAKISSIAIFGAPEAAKQLHELWSTDSIHKRLRSEDWEIAEWRPYETHEWPEVCSDKTQHGSGCGQSAEVQCGIVVIPTECDSKTVELVEILARRFEYLYVAPRISEDEVTAAPFFGKNSHLQVRVGGCDAEGETHPLKRAFDLIGAVCLMILSLPFCLFVAAVIPLTSKGPLLYKQMRIGKGNRMFYALKFRTMFLDAGTRLNQHLEKDPAMRAEWESVHKLKDDPRVTWIGKFLRRFSLDELPQIWNVFAGEMSLIGPRPIVVSEIERYGADYAAYEAVRPGLTGLWQVSGRNDTTYQERVDYDAYYVRHWSLRLDVSILARTIRAVISGTGAY